MFVSLQKKTNNLADDANQYSSNWSQQNMWFFSELQKIEKTCTFLSLASFLLYAWLK